MFYAMSKAEYSPPISFEPEQRLAPVIPLPIRIDQIQPEHEAINELLWSMDFKDDVVATRIMYRGVRTYGELAALTPAELDEMGLNEQEVGHMKALLTTKHITFSDHTPTE